MGSKQSIIPEPIDDEKVKEILRLSDEGKLTQAGIASEVAVSRATVGKYIRERKKQLAPRILRRFGDEDLESLCKALTPLIRQSLNGQGENRGKEEQSMSNGDAVGEARRQIEREEREKKTLDHIAEINKRLEPFKSFCEKFPQLCKRLEEKVDAVQQKPAEPKHLWLGGKETKHFDNPDLYSCCDSDDGKCSTNELCAEIPPSLRAKMLRVFCNDPECQKEMDKDGFELDGKGYKQKYRGMLGG